eukprot:TRINITY_DN8393_c1_g2_i1.p1 TRINITY_DN8393_c1_g2~~TRINITY_DN8393_c1_g2_i1.p1  ORF type:complete len:156 (+),score=20.34 TRINITY_DN8393_c1_g2_i1:136-603(+)
MNGSVVGRVFVFASCFVFVCSQMICAKDYACTGFNIQSTSDSLNNAAGTCPVKVNNSGTPDCFKYLANANMTIGYAYGAMEMAINDCHDISVQCNQLNFEVKSNLLKAQFQLNKTWYDCSGAGGPACGTDIALLSDLMAATLPTLVSAATCEPVR